MTGGGGERVVSRMKEHNYSVYMVASKSRVLYIGMSNDLHRRVLSIRMI
jgi:predicted GIY-YIG superfamily endonuclease